MLGEGVNLQIFQSLPPDEQGRLLANIAVSRNGNGVGGHSERTYTPKPLSLAELASRHFEPLEFLVDGLIAKGHFVVLAGRPKGGKSWFVLQLAMCVDTGQEFLQRKTRQASVLYVALEDTPRRVNQRAKQLQWQPTARAGILFDLARFDNEDGKPGPGLAQVRDLAASYDLIIIDTLIAALGGGASENSNEDMGAIANELANIAHNTDTAVLLIHHTNKASYEDVFQGLRGASAIRGAYDVGLLLSRKPDEKEATLHAESRDVEISTMTIRQKSNGEGWEHIGGGKAIEEIRSGRATLEAISSLDPEGNGVTADDIASHRHVSVQTIHVQLKKLVEEGRVSQQKNEYTPEGKKADLFFVIKQEAQAIQEPLNL